MSICSTLLNVPLKLKGRSRIRLGFGFFFCVFTIIFPCRCPHNAACPPAPPQNRWPSCSFFRTLFSVGRCFLLFPWPFSRTGNFCSAGYSFSPSGVFAPFPLEPSASAGIFLSPTLLRAVLFVAKFIYSASGIGLWSPLLQQNRAYAGFSFGKSSLFFCFYFIDPLSNIT